MSPLISGVKKQIGWAIVPRGVAEDAIDYYTAETFCKGCGPRALEDAERSVALYADEFRGDTLLCENCQKEFKFDEK